MFVTMKNISVFFEKHFFLLQYIILYYRCNLTMAIVGPHVRSAQPNEFPYIVSLMRINNVSRSESYHRCTGTLISKQDVLTADHCLRTTFTEGFKLMIGSHDLTKATEFFPIFVWTYEKWQIFKRKSNRNNTYHDIAFIKIIGDVPDGIELALTGYIENYLLFGLKVQTAGWGRTENNSIPRILQTTDLRVLSIDECKERILLCDNTELSLDERFFCSVGDPYAVLNCGDSGGPLVYFGAVVAINTAICPALDGNIHPHQINIHMSIRYYKEFFEDMKTNFFYSSK